MESSNRQAPRERSAARTLLTPKWLLGHVLALGLIVLFFNFGLWQLRRLEHREARNELIMARMEAPPASLDALLATDTLEEVEYRRTSTSGRFEPQREILLRSRSRDGQPGWHVLTPLLREDGSSVLVDRGWVPLGFDEPPVDEAAPTAGEVRVEGLLRLEQDPPEGWAANLAPRDPPAGELDTAYYVDVERLSPQFPYSLAPVYLELTGLAPAGQGGGPEQVQGSELPLPPRLPEFSRGSHLSYALQWFSFAVIGLVGYSILLWRTARNPASLDAP